MFGVDILSRNYVSSKPDFVETRNWQWLRCPLCIIHVLCCFKMKYSNNSVLLIYVVLHTRACARVLTLLIQTYFPGKKEEYICFNYVGKNHQPCMKMTILITMNVCIQSTAGIGANLSKVLQILAIVYCIVLQIRLVKIVQDVDVLCEQVRNCEFGFRHRNFKSVCELV